MKKNKIQEVLSEDFTYLFNTGENYHAYKGFGAHLMDGGVQFTVWVPDVNEVRVTGDFNGWDPYSAEAGDAYVMKELGDTGVRTCFVPGAKIWDRYKYDITLKSGKHQLKADPFAFHSETRPGTASKVCDPSYDWGDSEWMAERAKKNTFKSPMNIYEMHLGSWRRHEDGNFFSYRELGDELPEYVKDMGYTHLEIMPVMEHPLDASWGYQVTGYYAPTSRYGAPADFKYLVDKCHEAGLSVILDWVPGHFCPDEQGLSEFNGGKLYEKEKHPDWGTYKFDYGRPQVRSFLLSNAMYWIEEYHADGIRVDGVSSMLYLNFGIQDENMKKFNKYGDEGDLDAIEFLKEFNYMIGTRCPGVVSIAEESTAWPLITAPPDANGLGFHYKWNMGWMNDTLEYMKTDFPFRPGCHNKLTFAITYAYSENYILPLSHDEVVHGKCSLIGKMPGDTWRKFAGIRLLNLYQMTHPGKKLNFMGHELAEFIEFREYEELEWFMLQYENHAKYKDYIKDMNHVYRENPALWDSDTDFSGFQWIDADNNEQMIYTYIRRSLEKNTAGQKLPPKSASEEEKIEANKGELLVIAANAGVQAYGEYTIGVPEPGFYKEIINTDDVRYAGGGCVNPRQIRAKKKPSHGMPYSITIKMPPIGGCIFRKK